jgi:hypothetical protein
MGVGVSIMQWWTTVRDIVRGARRGAGIGLGGVLWHVQGVTWGWGDGGWSAGRISLLWGGMWERPRYCSSRKLAAHVFSVG